MADQNEEPTFYNLMIRLSQELEEFLIDAGAYESEDRKLHRKKVLDQLSAVVKQWINAVVDEFSIRNACFSNSAPSAEIYPFGSYSLDVHGPDSDIDVLCVGSFQVQRDKHFFDSLHGMLSQMPEVTQLVQIPGAKVPVMKFKFDGVAIDLIFAASCLRIIPQGFDPAENRGVFWKSETKSISSLNGYINTEMIKSHIGVNIENYRKALRFLKLWAKIRGIYSNIVGYLGGINLELLLCLVNQRCPNAIPSELVLKFFEIFSQWHWPSPVMLYKMEVLKDGHKLKNWNPVNPECTVDLMPTITPAFPCLNATYNVSSSTLAIIKEEIQRGQEICQDIMAEKKNWSTLFEPFLFFSAYKKYFQIELRANTAEDLREWKGWIESRLKRLVAKIEEKTKLKLHAHLHPGNFIDPSGPASHEHRCYFYMGLRRNKKLPMRAGDEFDLTRLMNDFRHKESLKCRTWKEVNMEIYVTYISATEIPKFVFTIESSKNKRFYLQPGEDDASGREEKRGAVSPNGSERPIPSPTKKP